MTWADADGDEGECLGCGWKWKSTEAQGGCRDETDGEAMTKCPHCGWCAVHDEMNCRVASFPRKPDAGTSCPACSSSVYVVTVKPGQAFCETCGQYIPLGRLV